MGLSIPFDHSTVNTTGAATATSIPVGGIGASDTLLAVIAHDAGSGSITGHNPADFTVSAGAIESATVDTSGKHLTVLYARG